MAVKQSLNLFIIIVYYIGPGMLWNYEARFENAL